MILYEERMAIASIFFGASSWWYDISTKISYDTLCLHVRDRNRHCRNVIWWIQRSRSVIQRYDMGIMWEYRVCAREYTTLPKFDNVTILTKHSQPISIGKVYDLLLSEFVMHTGLRSWHKSWCFSTTTTRITRCLQCWYNIFSMRPHLPVFLTFIFSHFWTVTVHPWCKIPPTLLVISLLLVLFVRWIA
jgi:hypothetical protein